MAKKEKGKWVLFMNHAQQMHTTEQMRPGSRGVIDHEGLLLTPGHLSQEYDSYQDAMEAAIGVQEYLQKDLMAKIPECAFPVVVKVIEIASLEKVEGTKPEAVGFVSDPEKFKKRYDALPKAEKEKLKEKAKRDRRRE